MSKVVVLKTKPETVLEDYNKLMNLADYKKILPKNKGLILKLNLSWSLYYPGCSTEPWQLEGVVKTLVKDGYKELYPVENRTVVTDVWKGAKGNKWLPVLKKYGLKYFPLTEAKWIRYKPKHEMLALGEIFPKGTWIPEMFIGKNVMHLPTMKCVHPDTEILLGDREPTRIKDLVNNVHNRNSTILTDDLDLVSRSKESLYTLNKEGNIIKGSAVLFWKTPIREKIIKLQTQSGKVVKVSKQHLFLTPNGWVQAKHLDTTCKIAVPKKEMKDIITTKSPSYNPKKNASIKAKTKQGKNWFSTSDSICWEAVDSLAEVKSDTPFLYDLTVETTNNFIGNGIILHNTHGHTEMTGAMKNAFGGLITMKRHHSHKSIHEVLVDLLQIQKEIHPKLFAVMDGTVCGDGAGPRTMDIKIKNYILASEDQVAIDAISAKMMGFDPMKIDFIRIAHDKGLGIGDPKQIDIIGEDISNVNFKFHTKKSLVIFMDQTLRKKYPIVEPILFHTPLFKLCIFGSGFYHDHIWYPFIGKKKIKKFMKTDWGQLFKRY